MTNLLQAEMLEPTAPANACVIWLHGLGADGHDFVPVVPHLNTASQHAIRYVFPHAPQRSVTCNGGFRMSAWYDIVALTEIRQINTDHLRASVSAINQIISDQIRQGIPAERMVLVGFSQGGAVAYHTALSCDQRLAGLIALSTYLPNPELLARRPSTNAGLPIYIAHGDADAMVTERAARLAEQWLIEQNYDVQWRRYPMAHEVCLAELRQIGEWLNECLANPADTGTP